MKRIYPLSLVFILLIGIAAVATASVHKYADKKAGIKAKFPAPFKVTETKADESTTVKAICEMNESGNYYVFLLSHTYHTVDMEGQEGLPEVSVDTFVEALNAEIDTKEEWRIKKNKDLSSTFHSDESGMKGHYKAIIIGQIQYQVVGLTAGGELDDSIILDFLKSVKIKG